MFEHVLMRKHGFSNFLELIIAGGPLYDEVLADLGRIKATHQAMTDNVFGVGQTTSSFSETMANMLRNPDITPQVVQPYRVTPSVECGDTHREHATNGFADDPSTPRVHRGQHFHLEANLIASVGASKMPLNQAMTSERHRNDERERENEQLRAETARLRRGQHNQTRSVRHRADQRPTHQGRPSHLDSASWRSTDTQTSAAHSAFSGPSTSLLTVANSAPFGDCAWRTPLPEADRLYPNPPPPRNFNSFMPQQTTRPQQQPGNATTRSARHDSHLTRTPRDGGGVGDSRDSQRTRSPPRDFLLERM